MLYKNRSRGVKGEGRGGEGTESGQVVEVDKQAELNKFMKVATPIKPQIQKYTCNRKKKK